MLATGQHTLLVVIEGRGVWVVVLWFGDVLIAFPCQSTVQGRERLVYTVPHSKHSVQHDFRCWVPIFC